MQSSSSEPSGKHSTNRPKALIECSSFVALMKRTRQLKTLDRLLRQPLPASLRDQCCLADVRAERIVFLASSSIWAAKLRLYQTPMLASAQSVLGYQIKKFTVKVASLPPVPPEPKKTKPLSETTAQHLVAAAQHLSDPELRTLYLQLASLAERSSSHN